MASIVFLIFLSLIAFAAVSVATALLKKRLVVPMGQERPPRRPNFYLAAIAAIVVFVLGLAVSCFTQVPTSTIGVVTVFGDPQQQVLTEGPHFVLPVAVIHPVSIGLETVQIKQAEAASKDMQRVFTSITMNYRVDPERARGLFIKNPALNYEDTYVGPAMFETFKAVAARYTAEQLITMRNQVSNDIVAALKTKLAPYGMIVQDINITDFSFSKAFDDAIEAKVTATQKAEQAERDLQRVKYEAEQQVAKAKGDAEAIQIQSQAIQQNGGDAYLKLQMLKQWDGHLPMYVVSGSSGASLINMLPAATGK